MPYFQIMLSGSGISVPVEGGRDLATGFFTTRFVKADNGLKAQELAKELVLSEWRQDGCYATVNRGAVPLLVIEHAFHVGMLTGILRRKVNGYSFYLND